jgi:hypothetical protein
MLISLVTAYSYQSGLLVSIYNDSGIVSYPFVTTAFPIAFILSLSSRYSFPVLFV